MNRLPQGLPPEAYDQMMPEEEQSPNYLPPGITPWNYQNINVVDKQLETNPTMEQLRDWLLGIEGKGKDGKPIIIKGRRMVNEIGCSALLSELNSSLAPQAVLGYLSDEDYLRYAKDFEIELPFKLIHNRDVWEVNTTHKDVICDTIGRLFCLNLTRAIRGATHKGITQISLVREQSSSRDMGQPSGNTPEDKGLFEWLGFKKRR